MNFRKLALYDYTNESGITLNEFESDLMHFMYIEKLLLRYALKGELKAHMILNHMIMLLNVFPSTMPELMFHYIDKTYENVFGTFLIHMNKLPKDKTIAIDSNVLVQLIATC